MRRSLALAAIPVLLVSAGATAQTPGPHSGEAAEIPFATHDGIRTFTADSDRMGVYLQDQRKNWYYARFNSPCADIDFDIRIGFKTFGGSSTLSNNDVIYAGHEECRIIQLVHSGPPPSASKKPAKHG